MSEPKYCMSCSIQKGHPSVIFDENGVCNICAGHVSDDIVTKYTDISANYDDFINSQKNMHGKYDCLLMLSGGKDSLYILHKLKDETSKNVLAFTFQSIYLSISSKANLNKCKQYLSDMDFMPFYSDQKYISLMSDIFSREYSRDEISKAEIAEKLPCEICTLFMIINACLTAIKQKIPYVLHGADPLQMVGLGVDLKKIMKRFNKIVGEKMARDVLGNQHKIILDTDDDDLPKLVYPLVSLFNEYNKEKLIEYLNKTTQYESNKIRTSCKLDSFLQYFSFKNFNCYAGALTVAASVRDNAITRDFVIQAEKDYKKIILEIAVKKEISEEEKKYIKDVADQLTESEGESDILYNNFLSFRSLAEEIGVFEKSDATDEDFLKSTMEIDENF